MIRKIISIIFLCLLGVVIYFLVWPVSIEPVSWQAPPNPGYTGPFSSNDRLKALEFLPIGDNDGPEAITVDANGLIYTGCQNGTIVRLQKDGSDPEDWVNTGGRPLGLDFDRRGNLIVADAYRGLLSIAPNKTITVLAGKADGVPIRFADDVDCATDGKIYFTDASTKFGARESGGTYEASLLDLNEHGGHGRLLVYDPDTGVAKTLMSGLNFANGVAVSHDQTYVLVVEMGSYRIIRYWISGTRKGESKPFIEALPSFPDNITTGLENRFWVAFVSPRNVLIDTLSGQPFLRKVIQRLPKYLRPKAVAYGHIIAIDGDGNILQDLQDPDGAYQANTSVMETRDSLYIGSLFMPVLGRVPKENIR